MVSDNPLRSRKCNISWKLKTDLFDINKRKNNTGMVLDKKLNLKYQIIGVKNKAYCGLKIKLNYRNCEIEILS